MSSYSAFIEEAMKPKAMAARSKRRIVRGAVAGGVAVLTLIAICFGVWEGVKTHKHNILVAQLQEKIEPRKVFAAVRSGEISQEEAMGLMRESPRFQQRAKEMHDYFALRPGPAREQFLNKLIDARMKDIAARGGAMPSNGGPRTGPAGPGGPGGPGGPSASPGGSGQPERAANQRATFMESIPPGDRAEMQQFRYDMHQQMQKRGI